MIGHHGSQFSTSDRDNDNNFDINCAAEYSGGWWFQNYARSNLNGIIPYNRSKQSSKVLSQDEKKHAMWGGLSILESKLMIRPHSL